MTSYLDENLKPLIQSIQPKRSQSYILEALNLDRNSAHGIQITFGERIEQFWNKVISDSSATNLIEDDNIVEVNGKNRQIDHLFEWTDYSNDVKSKFYLESKCCLNFDSEKVKASNKKIQEIKETVGADEAGYFIPVVSTIDQKYLTKYNNKGLNVYGVKWLLSKIDAPFTESEFFAYMRETIAPILEKKGL
tara:strand:- start:872 stop:1447 length:576 start_codon:yes stop_codon:yes gene_type:complete